jgi:hypothetical protein
MVIAVLIFEIVHAEIQAKISMAEPQRYSTKENPVVLMVVLCMGHSGRQRDHQGTSWSGTIHHCFLAICRRFLVLRVSSRHVQHRSSGSHAVATIPVTCTWTRKYLQLPTPTSWTWNLRNKRCITQWCLIWLPITLQVVVNQDSTFVNRVSSFQLWVKRNSNGKPHPRLRSRPKPADCLIPKTQPNFCHRLTPADFSSILRGLRVAELALILQCDFHLK